MRAGRLSKTELARVVRSYRDIQGLLDKLPKIHRDKTEESTANCLIEARGGLGDLLRWQDFGGAWQDAQKQTNANGDGRREKSPNSPPTSSPFHPPTCSSSSESP